MCMGYGHSCAFHVSTICSSYRHGAKLNQKHVGVTLFGPNMSTPEKQMGHMLVLQLPSTWSPSNVQDKWAASNKMYTEGGMQRQV